MNVFRLLTALTAGAAGAADRFVTPSGAGTRTGADWTNALPGSFNPVRGDVYYFATGTYPDRTLDTAPSGAATIVFRKCTTTDGRSSTAAGYVPSLCQGQAHLGSIFLASDHWILDGVTRNESNWADGNSYGFRAIDVSTRSTSVTEPCASHITVRNMNLGGPEGTSYTGTEPGQAVYLGGFADICTAWTIENNYLHNIGSFTIIQFAGVREALVQRNQFQNSWGKEAIRGQHVAANVIIRWNRFLNACGYTGLPGEGCTAEIAIWSSDTPGSFDNNEIYGNWFVLTRDATSGGTIVVGGDNGANWHGVPAANARVYNNSFAGHAGGWRAGQILVNGSSGNICRNNLWYDAPASSATCAIASHNVVATANPFVGYPGTDLHLSWPTSAGQTLSPPYDLDMDGQPRGSDGTWDLGAFEYSISGVRRPAPPSSLVITP